MLFQRSKREQFVSRIIFYSGVLVFLCLMDFFQKIAAVEIHMERQGIAATDALEQFAMPAWLAVFVEDQS